ncbi:TrmB family transcriptional regulator [Candidatus Uhrbacteria bacterium]|nr:TrmB family transcriptional regulator [Candidatus Uhrbacteria bacterium]
MDIVQILKKLGFDEKDIRVYLILLSLGPSPVRKIAQATGINRGTTYDILKHLMKQGLVVYHHKEKHQYFFAEDPLKLERHLDGRLEELSRLRQSIQTIIPELQSMYNRGGGKPVARYYEGFPGVKNILQGVLATMSKEKQKEYYVYSSANLRDFLHKSFPNFTRERIKRGIIVKVIALGEGGKEHPLSERKWLTKDGGSPAYTLIYGPKTAHISIDSASTPLGVVVEDPNIAHAHRMVFEKLWLTL